MKGLMGWTGIPFAVFWVVYIVGVNLNGLAGGRLSPEGFAVAQILRMAGEAGVILTGVPLGVMVVVMLKLHIEADHAERVKAQAESEASRLRWQQNARGIKRAAFSEQGEDELLRDVNGGMRVTIGEINRIEEEERANAT